MMNTPLTEDTKAIILLCGFFGQDRAEKPLSLVEYSSLVRWLISVDMRPSNLLNKETLTEASLGTNISSQRLGSLLGRGVQLGFAVEEWQRNGIWIISRSDADYPIRYKKHLKDKAPPIMFGVGDRSLLNGGGLGIVGSRNVDHDGETFSRHVATLCAHNRIPVVSGGARGVDQISMTAALDAGGISIGILAENLLKKSVERKYRYAISDGRLLLISPYHPRARFTVGTAMSRNKLIYALADYGLVVSATQKKGGTWAGATEELKRDNSRPVFVRTGNNVPSGNSKLLDYGAIAWPQSTEKEGLKQQLEEISAGIQSHEKIQQPVLFDAAQGIEEHNISKTEKPSSTVENPSSSCKSKTHLTIYDAVLPIILDSTKIPVSSAELAEQLDVGKPQLNKWLQKAVEAGFIKKHSRPIRFEALLKNSSAEH